MTSMAFTYATLTLAPQIFLPCMFRLFFTSAKYIQVDFIIKATEYYKPWLDDSVWNNLIWVVIVYNISQLRPQADKIVKHQTM